VTISVAEKRQLLRQRTLQRATLPSEGSVQARKVSLLSGSNLTCRPSLHSQQFEVCKEPYRICAEAMILLSLVSDHLFYCTTLKGGAAYSVA